MALAAISLALLLFSGAALQRLGLRRSWRIGSGVPQASGGGALATASAAAEALAAAAAAAKAQAARSDYLLAALEPLLQRDGNDVMAIERVVDLLVLAGSLSGKGGSGGAGARARPRLVQIGANDAGASANDPIFNRLRASEAEALEAVLVEPVPHLFEAMAASYANLTRARRGLSIRPLWAAACPPGSGATRLFYSFRANASAYFFTNTRTGMREAFKPHVQQLGSFRLGHLAHTSHATEADLAPALLLTHVPCTDLQKIMCEQRWAPGSLDYLHIDAEGFDFAVVQASSLAATRPRVIRLEAQHIAADECEAFLTELGYRVIRFNANGVNEMLAILTRPGASRSSAPLNCSAAA